MSNAPAPPMADAFEAKAIPDGRSEGPPVNIADVALIFEGGGMRASYTAGAVVALLEGGFNFADVYGISAGSSHAANYVSRDAVRARAAFTDFVQLPGFGGVGSLLRGMGYFNGPYLYEGIAEELAGTGDPLAFKWDAFCANPAQVHIEAFDWESGETVSWTKADMPTMRDLLLRVRASSTMPLFMPPTTIDGRTFMDGGLGSSWGLLLHGAEADGYERFFIVRTQPKDYRKKPMGRGAQVAFRWLFRKHPLVAQATIERWHHYNALLDEVEELERQGAAYVFYPEAMAVSNKTTDHAALCASYEAGYAQARREQGAWECFLG